MHFFLDSRMLLYRAGVITTNETLMDNLFFIGDFGADLSVVIHSTLKLLQLSKQKHEMLADRGRILALCEQCDSITCIGDSSADIHSLLADCDHQLTLLAEDQCRATMRLTIWSIQLISSGNYPPVNVWRRLFGYDCPGTVVGLSGVLSSSLVLYDTISGLAGMHNKDDV
jgi:hypothetical protein